MGSGSLVRSFVFDGGVLMEEFRREVVFRDRLLVVERKVITMEAERTDPDFGGEVDDGKGVEYGSAIAAAERGVREERGGVG